MACFIIACDDLTINITIVVPKEITPYYDWLLDYPGWQISPQEPPSPTDPGPSNFQANKSGKKTLLNFTNKQCLPNTQNHGNIYYNQFTGDIK